MSDRDQAVVGEPLHIEAIAWMVSRLDKDERQQFEKGFMRRVEDIGDLLSGPVGPDTPSDAVKDFLTWLRSWQVSISLREDTEWHKDVESTYEALKAGNVDELDAEGLRRLLSA